MEDGRHDSQVWYFSVVGMSPVDGVGLALTHVDGERFPVVGFVGVIGLAVVADEILDEGIRAGSVVGRIGKG